MHLEDRPEGSADSRRQLGGQHTGTGGDGVGGIGGCDLWERRKLGAETTQVDFLTKEKSTDEGSASAPLGPWVFGEMLITLRNSLKELQEEAAATAPPQLACRLSRVESLPLPISGDPRERGGNSARCSCARWLRQERTLPRSRKTARTAAFTPRPPLYTLGIR